MIPLLVIIAFFTAFNVVMNALWLSDVRDRLDNILDELRKGGG